MRKDGYYEDDEDLEELERQRAEIERKIRNMTYEDDAYAKKASSAKSSAAGARRSSAKSKNASQGGRVTHISADEIDYYESGHSSSKSRSRKTGSQDVQKKSSYYSSAPDKRTRKAQIKKKNRRRKRRRRIISRLALIVIIIAAVICGAMYYMLSGLTRTQLEGDLSDTGGVSYIKNIALYGVDTRDPESSTGLSDAIMIMSVNKKTAEIKLISVLRDSNVYIEGYGETKINAAYSYGGASLAVKTLNQNFSLDITDYITVNFAQLAAIIDAAGGVTIEITAEEAEQINKNLDDAAEEDMTVQEVEYVTVADQTVLLNGDQAVAYSRIRKIDSDNMRAGRQQKVLSALLENIKSMPVWKYPVFIRKLLSVSESSLSNAEIISFAPLAFRNFTISTYTVPDIDYETDLTSGYNSYSQWCWFYDLDGAAERIHSIIYE